MGLVAHRSAALQLMRNVHRIAQILLHQLCEQCTAVKKMQCVVREKYRKESTCVIMGLSASENKYNKPKFLYQQMDKNLPTAKAVCPLVAGELGRTPGTGLFTSELQDLLGNRMVLIISKATHTGKDVMYLVTCRWRCSSRRRAWQGSGPSAHPAKQDSNIKWTAENGKGKPHHSYESMVDGG